MLKYILRIEGTAEEIDKEKRHMLSYTIETKTVGPGHFVSHVYNFERIVLNLNQIEYITREPKMRIKTLAELVQEYPDRICLDNYTVMINGCTCYRTKLGLPEEANFMSKEWKEIFLKEIT
jgi:hypothetical protein